MTKEELLKRLDCPEWNDIEFKEALNAVPKSAYESVSAFANTGGGYLVFGIKEKDSKYEVSGVNNVDKVQNEFLSNLNSEQKLNHQIEVKEYLLNIDGHSVLVFYIPELKRQEKPLYLNGNINRSFIRRVGRNERCRERHIANFLRNASDERNESQTISLNPESCFDEASIKWYRAIFNQTNPDKDPSISNLEFLHYWGLIIEDKNDLRPTKASIFLFGNEPSIHQLFARPMIDCQWINAKYGENLPGERWFDRLVIEENLISTWRSVVARYMQHAEKPFQIDLATLRRSVLSHQLLIMTVHIRLSKYP